VKLLLQFIVKSLLIDSDFSTPFSFYYNVIIIIVRENKSHFINKGNVTKLKIKIVLVYEQYQILYLISINLFFLFIDVC
jgi:hypothetical protein